jgi:hypothetical protein
MGYRVAAHLVAGEADWSRLSVLPESLTWSVRRHEGFYGIDVQRAWKAVPEPYAVMALKDVPSELPEGCHELRAIQAFLAMHDEASAFPGDAFNLGVQLSETLDTRVLTIWADDDSLDFALQSEAGAPMRLRFGSNGVEVTWTPEQCSVVPLEDEEGPPNIDLGALRERIPNLELGAMQAPDPLLHRVAAEEARAFVGGASPPLGLGSFDGDPAPSEVVAPVP